METRILPLVAPGILLRCCSWTRHWIRSCPLLVYKVSGVAGQTSGLLSDAVSSTLNTFHFHTVTVDSKNESQTESDCRLLPNACSLF